MSTFMGMPSGRSLLLCAAVTALCVSLASAAADKKRTVANSDKLLNNLYGTVITANKPWTPDMMMEFAEFCNVNNEAAVLNVQPAAAKIVPEPVKLSEPVMSTKDRKQVVVRVELTHRAKKRAANDVEKDVVDKQKLMFSPNFVAMLSSFKSTGADAWKVTKLDVDQLVSKYGVKNNINEGMSEEFYAAFPASASSAYGLAVNKVVVGLGVVVATFLAVC
eukprot:GHVS01078281.1.p1 GENE.GHVS01078281.1~~GHVS01078281.1.p1  ORF type:complete len:220 (-),score=46.62 GHVS01078281.1:21-680(-)